MSPVGWVLRRHVGLLIVSLTIMAVAPYLGSLPVRTIPHVVALASDMPGPSSTELNILLGSRVGDLTAVLAALVIAGALSFALALANTRVGAMLSSAATRDLRLALHERVLARPPDYLRQPGRANMAKTAMLNQCRVVASYAANTIPAGLGIAFAIAIWSHTLFTAVDSPGQRTTAAAVVAAVVIALLAGNLLTVWLSGRKSQRGQKRVITEQGKFIGLANESVDKLTTLQLNTAQAAQHRRAKAILTDMSAAEISVASWSGLAAAASGGMVLLGIPVLVMAWRALELQGEQLAVMVPALLMLQRAISSVGSLWTSRKVSRPAIDLIAELLAPEPAIPSVGQRVSKAHGALTFKAVRWTVDGRDVLRGVDLEVHPGETVALVGRGGSGKSTLLRLALRLQKPTSGRIQLDGVDVGNVSLSSLRCRIGILEQHPALFSRSLRDNLILDDARVTDEDILAAAHTAQFTEVIERLPQGLDSPLTAQDSTLSGSERRRLALTRLLLRQPDVIFIDELEAGLPQADAQALLRDVRAVTQGKTCLMVTHRPDLLAADRIAFVHEGCILESAPHAELEVRCAAYRSLLAEHRGENDAND